MVQTPPAGILSNEVKNVFSLSFAALPLGKAVSVDLMKDNPLLRQSVYARHFSAGPVSKTGAVVYHVPCDHVTM